MSQQLRSLSALSEDLGAVPSIHLEAHNSVNSSPGDVIPSFGLCRHQISTQYTYIHPSKINQLNLKIKENLIGKRWISENSALLGRVVNSFNTSIWKSKAEAGRCLRVSGQPGLKGRPWLKTKPPMNFEDSSRKQKLQQATKACLAHSQCFSLRVEQPSRSKRFCSNTHSWLLTGTPPPQEVIYRSNASQSQRKKTPGLWLKI